MGIFLVLIASFFAASSNLAMRRSIDFGSTSRAFLMIQLSIAFVASIFMNPIRTQIFSWNYPIIYLGLFMGVVLGVMMYCLGKSFEKGPVGLSVSALNASTVVPGIVMAFLFGKALGYDYHIYHALGSLLVLIGLFWAGANFDHLNNRKMWLFFISGAFLLHVFFLVGMQWRALMINAPEKASFFRILTPSEATSQWFMPAVFFGASVLQIFLFFFHEKRKLKSIEWGYGIFGGLANCSSTFFLIWATEVATSVENAMIFPIFSVGIILLCNTWGRYLYQEQINWKASQLCACGIFLGCVDWSKVVPLFGF